MVPTTPLDVLIPTYSRPSSLAVTLTSLCAQTLKGFRVVISDQTEDYESVSQGEVQTVLRVLALHGNEVETHRNLPRRGMAQQRQFLLDKAQSPYVVYLDDDLILEPDILDRMLAVIRNEKCGLVGCAPIGLSYLHDVRPHQQHIEFWDGPVQPERIVPLSEQWGRHTLHSAANILHVQTKLGLTAPSQRTYRLAWVGGCVLFDTEKLREAGGFGFWRELPREHCGEDVLAQLRVMEKWGGCGLIPSGVYHMELPTTLPHREVNAPEVFVPAATPARQPSLA